jgi:oxygen-independent coproporphyrinogen-3 oxidase
MNSTLPNPGRGIYFHVPFCASTCDFCAFYQEQPKRGDIDRYLSAMERELEINPPGKVDTAFWGGGTPGLLPAEDLYRLGQALTQAAGKPKEWTVELAPSSVREDKLAALKEAGVTRVSLGVQSFDEETLETLGRRHSPKQIHDAWQAIESIKFASRNLDLIFGIPGQDEERWLKDLERVVDLNPQHLSTYCLTFEEDTALFVKMSQGKIKIDKDREAYLYRKTWQYLEQKGYAQYEVSNFAQKGFACEHNLITWHMGDWIGYGPSASSQWHGQRWTNPANLESWIEGIEQNLPRREQEKSLSPSDILSDALVFGLRLNAGVSPFALAERLKTSCPQGVLSLFADCVEEGLMELKGDCFCLTEEGRLRADAVGVEVLKQFD